MTNQDEILHRLATIEQLLIQAERDRKAFAQFVGVAMMLGGWWLVLHFANVWLGTESLITIGITVMGLAGAIWLIWAVAGWIKSAIQAVRDMFDPNNPDYWRQPPGKR